MLTSNLSVADLLHSLTIAGLRLEVLEGQLKVIGNTHLLTDQQRQSLSHHKALLLTLCPKARDVLTSSPDAWPETLTPEQERLFYEACEYFEALVAKPVVCCPSCRGVDLYDTVGGIACNSCKCYAWYVTRRGLVRADFDEWPEWIEWKAPANINYSNLGLRHPAFDKPLGEKPRRKPKRHPTLAPVAPAEGVADMSRTCWHSDRERWLTSPARDRPGWLRTTCGICNGFVGYHRKEEKRQKRKRGCQPDYVLEIIRPHVTPADGPATIEAEKVAGSAGNTNPPESLTCLRGK